MTKVGLLLEGGGMRGMYTAGVLDVLMEHDIKVDGMVCVSAGALFGVNYLSKQKGRALRYNLNYLLDKRYMGWHSFLTTGNMVNKEFTYYTVPFTLDPFDNETYKSSNIPVHVPITNVETGQAEFVMVSDVFQQMEVLRAASALPIVSKLVEIDGKFYLDGGMADSIPIDFMQEQSFDKIIIVLTRPKDYRKKKVIKWVYQLLYRRYPKLVETIANRHEHYNATVEKIMKLEEEGKVFVIRPTENITIGRLEKSKQKIQEIYDLGSQNMHQRLEKLYAYLEKE
ncbi:patatin family protein [Carnobacteriaceae bacterium zg-ZUI240]|nr:patatin family protein [Carnobacteriaceae bacterium zg-ZUI240]